MITIKSLEQSKALVAELDELHGVAGATVSQMAAGTLIVSTIRANRSELWAYIRPNGQVSRP